MDTEPTETAPAPEPAKWTLLKKPDIRAPAMLSWDAYREKPYDKALPSIYAHASAEALRYATWYWDSIRTKRRTSLGVRFLTFLLLIGGTLLPILAGLGDKPDQRLQLTQLGVTALALGGLLQIGDRVFGWSSGWLRYISTATAMENLARGFEIDWAAYVLGKSGRLADADVKPLFDLAAHLQQGLIKLQNEETESWKIEFNTGAALLGDLIKSQRESNEKATDAARAAVSAQKVAEEVAAKARQPGAIEVSLVHKGAPVEVGIAVDDGQPERFLGVVWSKQGLSPGQHRVTLTTTDAQATLIARKQVEVKAGANSAVEIQLA